MKIFFRNFSPDLPSIGNPGLANALNMRPKMIGWYAAKGLKNLTNATALLARPRGSISGTTPDGNGYMMAGDGTSLYVFTDSGMTNRSRASGYTLGDSDRWGFEEFGNQVFAVSRNTDMQFVTIGSTDLFDDIPTAPRARHVAVAANKFLMLGNIIDSQGVDPNAIRWSAINNPQFWPEVGSDDAIQVQSDRQVLEGSGGGVQDLVAGAEVTAVFREKSIHRMDYVGGTAIFNIREVDKGGGMMIPYSGVPYNRSIFYIAEDGFRTFDYTQTASLGKDRVDQTFLSDLDNDHLDKVWTALDPDRTVIWVAYPGSGNTDGQPNKLLLYDYALDQWSPGEQDISALIENVNKPVASLDAPEDLPTDPDDVDDAGTGPASFDDRLTGAGASRMGAFDPGFIPSDFTGEPLKGLIETGEIELNPGRRALVVSARPVVSNVEARVAVSARGRTADPPGTFSAFSDQNSDGKCSLRSDGRYHTFRVELPAQWEDAVMLDVKVVPTGER